MQQKTKILQTQKRKVLVIDDDPNIVGLVKTLLDTTKINFVALDLDSKLVEEIKKESPDVILLDIMMPNINGFDLCKMIKSEKEIKNIPIIFMSAKDHIADKIKALNCGGVDYVIKPFNPFVLEDKIIQLVK